MAVQGVIFDMDGVLVLTEEAHWESWRVPAAARGVSLDYKTFQSCFGRINADCIRIMFGADIAAAESEKIADEKEKAFRDIVRHKVPLAPGTVELLKKLREVGMKLAVGSSGPRENVELILSAGGIARYFDATVNGGEVKNGKPAPDVFLLAAQRMGLRAGDCAVIEDAPAGIRAAVAAGMMAVGVATTHAASELKDAGAGVVFADLASVPVAIARNVANQGRWSVEDYLRLPGNHLVELSDGNVEVLPMPTQMHQQLVGYLYRVIVEFVGAVDLGKVLFAPLPVRLSPTEFREPDVIFMLKANAARRHNEYWEAADWVIEVVGDDDPKRDMETKRAAYARAGIPEYWIVDPRYSQVMVLSLEGDRYVEVGVFKAGDQAISSVVKGFVLDVERMFADARE